jgi:6-hydroxycyclohex-1-ene-1-carbonyl-CoA dehydrogenase
VAVIVGAGGIGGFGVQIAAALGANVVAIDIDGDRLELARQHRASLTLNSGECDEKQLKAQVRKFAGEFGAQGSTLKIFEMSGTAAGQQTAFNLLDFGAYLGIVGYTPKKVELRLSNLMAFDATAQGNWGCPAEQYPNALRLVLDRKIILEPFIERHKLEEIPEIMAGMAKHAFRRRVVLVPNGPAAGPRRAS